MKFLRSKKAMLAAGLATGLLVSGGIAYAVWTANGTGSGSATAASAKTATVTASSSADDNLWPGNATAVPVHFVVDNTNPYPVSYSTFSDAAISNVAPGPLSGTCDANDFQWTATSGNLASAVSAAANSSNNAGATANILQMKSTAGDACQGAVVTVSLKVAGTQV
jgi:hypothetical protein